jgi:hypothetical protein
MPFIYVTRLREKLLLPALIIFLVLYCPSIARANEYYYPKQEGGKWGIYMHYQELKKGITTDKEKWLFKPKWDMVWVDSSRFGCSAGRSCDGFITLKKGKYGYAWSNGELLDNDFEFINIRRHVAKKNGRWGAFQEHIPVLPFEYDSIIFNNSYYTDSRDGIMAYAVLKENVWQLASVPKEVEANPTVSSLLSEPFYNYLYHPNGLAIKRKDGWYFVNLLQKGRPVFSGPHDSILNARDHYAIRQQGKWFIVDKNIKIAMDKGWDDIKSTSEWNYAQVWENNLLGLVYYKDNTYSLLISPRATDVEITRKIGEDPVIVLTEQGQLIAYNARGQVVSSSGDVTVKHTEVKGPFRISYHENQKRTVFDASTNAVLIPESNILAEYKNDPESGHVLYVKMETYPGSRGYYYGLYHYNSKTYLKPEFIYEFKLLGPKYIFSKVKGAGVYEDMRIWDKKTMQPLSTPFIVRNYKDKYQLLLQDALGEWHELDANFTIVPPSKVIYSRGTIVGGIEVEETESQVKTILKINDKPVNTKIEKDEWLADDKVYALTMNGKRMEYFDHNGRAQTCNYNLSQGMRKINMIMPARARQGTTIIAPIVFADSVGKLVLISAADNYRQVIPASTTAQGIKYKEIEYTICGASSFESINFCGQAKEKCMRCTAGYVSKVVKETIKGEVTYTTKKNTTTQKGSESKWDPKINGYKRVDTYKPVTTYETIEKRAPDRIVEKTVKVKCEKCDGKGVILAHYDLYWDGKILKSSAL